MARRIAGIAYLKVDGAQYDLAGNFTTSTSMITRQMMAGQDGVHDHPMPNAGSLAVMGTATYA